MVTRQGRVRGVRCGAPCSLRRLIANGPRTPGGGGVRGSRGRTSVLYWLLKYFILGPWLKLIFRPQVEGREYVPDTGPAIIASNHLSFSDSIFMPLIVKRPVTFVAKAEYFTGKGLKGWLTKMFFVGTGCIPVDRSGGRAAQAALDTQLRVLREGNLA